MTFNAFEVVDSTLSFCKKIRSFDLITDILLAFALPNLAYVKMALKTSLLPESLLGPHVSIKIFLMK